MTLGSKFKKLQRIERWMRVQYALIERAKDRGEWDYELETFKRRTA